MTCEIVTIEVLKERAASLRTSGKRVVVTVGYFDILQPAHVELLEKTKAMGDILCVGVFSDESISHSLSSYSPIYPCHERMEILSTLSMPDFVFECSADTRNSVREIVPDIIVTSFEYSPDEEDIRAFPEETELLSVDIEREPRTIAQDVIQKYTRANE